MGADKPPKVCNIKIKHKATCVEEEEQQRTNRCRSTVCWLCRLLDLYSDLYVSLKRYFFQTESMANAFQYKQYTACVFKWGVCVITLEVHVHLCINSVSVYILSTNALNEKVMIGLQTTRQQVGKRHIPKVGQQPGILGLMSRWTNR